MCVPERQRGRESHCCHWDNEKNSEVWKVLCLVGTSLFQLPPSAGSEYKVGRSLDETTLFLPWPPTRSRNITQALRGLQSPSLTKRLWPNYFIIMSLCSDHKEMQKTSKIEANFKAAHFFSLFPTPRMHNVSSTRAIATRVFSDVLRDERTGGFHRRELNLNEVKLWGDRFGASVSHSGRGKGQPPRPRRPRVRPAS